MIKVVWGGGEAKGAADVGAAARAATARTRGGPTAPPEGLYLVSVAY